MALNDVISPRVVELGKIKIGSLGEERTSRAGGKWRMPQKLDHFVVVGLNRDEKGDLKADTRLMEDLAADGFADPDGKLRRLPIAVLSNDLDDIMQSAFVCYQGKRLLARSDGVTLWKYGDGKDKWFAVPEEHQWTEQHLLAKDSKGNQFFKAHTTFNCTIVSRQAHFGGVYKLRTTSRITAGQLAGSLISLRGITGGILRGLPLQLVIRPMQVAPKGQPSTIYVVHCELLADDFMAIQRLALERAQLEVSNRKALEAAKQEYRALLREPGERETSLEEAEVAQEFHPDAEPEAAPPEDDPLLATLLNGITGEEGT